MTQWGKAVAGHRSVLQFRSQHPYVNKWSKAVLSSVCPALWMRFFGPCWPRAWLQVHMDTASLGTKLELIEHDPNMLLLLPDWTGIPTHQCTGKHHTDMHSAHIHDHIHTYINEVNIKSPAGGCGDQWVERRSQCKSPKELTKPRLFTL